MKLVLAFTSERPVENTMRTYGLSGDNNPMSCLTKIDTATEYGTTHLHVLAVERPEPQLHMVGCIMLPRAWICSAFAIYKEVDGQLRTMKMNYDDCTGIGTYPESVLEAVQENIGSLPVYDGRLGIRLNENSK